MTPLINFGTIVAQAQTAPATTPAGQPPQGPPPWANFVPLALIVVVFYFIFLRPQQKRQKEQADMMKSIKAGDKILTTGGILAVVVTVKEKSISIRSADSKMEISKNAVAEVIERSGEASAD